MHYEISIIFVYAHDIWAYVYNHAHELVRFNRIILPKDFNETTLSAWNKSSCVLKI